MTQGSDSVRHAGGTTGTVLHHFERWARETPEAPALIAAPKHRLPYGVLDARANRLAHHLLARGLPPGGLVALGTTRHEELVVGILAVLKAGGSYTLLDAETPRTGRQQLAALHHLSPFALLTRAPHRAALDTGSGLRAIRTDDDAAEIAARPGHAPDLTQAADGLAPPPPGGRAAVLFTASTTPRPVAVGHPVLLAAHAGWTELARPTPQDRHLITARPDVTAFAAGWTRALCTGGALVVPPDASWRTETPDQVRAAVEAEQVTVLHTDPAGIAALVIDGPRPAAADRRSGPRPLRSLRLATVTGDRLHLDELDALHVRLRPGVRILDVYGLTETAGAGTCFELPHLPAPVTEPERLALLGTPFAGCRVDVRDGEIHLTPPGGGDALPTGDLGVLRPDGLLEYAGRLRHRIPVQGGSLDPHPVEAAIRTHPGIGGAVLAGVDKDGERRLVAYVSPPPGDPAWDASAPLPEIRGLRNHLAGVVLKEESPTVLIRLRALPRKRGGQEDRSALPLPARPGSDRPALHGGKFTRAVVRPGDADGGRLVTAGCLTIVLAFLTLALTPAVWPGSTDLSAVPYPWAALFFLLYVAESVAFGAGLAFLFTGHRLVERRERGRSPVRIRAVHLAVSYLLLAWWPQDNAYRLAARQDWPLQALLVYTFNIPLMIAGIVLALHLARPPDSPFDVEDRT
ncbi:AMP-binding protein [Streptomyces sp. PCS3-D2]|uniref:AMP-binding protein n=1 Tax=Streptomyces sp. PCS3-D2 TaxID=1460244 RepID=UPI00044F118D|nr:AMP-binding protein [Streptomyces sp. PCS3-D2]WKV70285.1 AMP-binding protein [Streptomyces sp. PCS3-D2]